MSDLQIGLLVIGVAIVAGVLAFNWLQERRFRKQADAAFQAPMGDALMQPGGMLRETAERVEPALREPVFDAALSDAVSEAEVRRESAPAPQAEVAPAPPPTPVHEVPPNVTPRPAGPTTVPYDELIEYRVRLGGETCRPACFPRR
jgi:hypothetical protein